MPKIGPYIHQDDCIARLTFGIDRGLTVVLYQSYQAGIIGPEYNGIAILDDDHGQTVLDLHQREASGSNGPSSAQRAEFDRLKAMTWPELMSFIANHPRRRRELASDLRIGSEPARGDLVLQAARGRDVTLAQGPDIRSPEMIEATNSETVPYAFPEATRSEIMARLLKHASHPTNMQFGRALAWNIKIHDYDELAKTGENEVDAAFDVLWKARLAGDGDLFWSASSDALMQYVNAEATTWPGDDQGDWEFRTEGRSGGWLILSQWQGRRMEFSSFDEYQVFLEELSDPELVNFYKGIAVFDADLASPREIFDSHMNFRRFEVESIWRSTPALAVDDALTYDLPAAEFAKVAMALSLTVDALVDAMVEADAKDSFVLDVVEAHSGLEERERIAANLMAPTPAL
ncbi:hypothetical protein [Bosea sp. RAC05]|uniref:hypothetical protein n=1 Tax=Bosea sp. RAC05 TaxID=1842539 RepID=UPI00083E0D65|nr:hypothetical protein [Bosea sp. RAC05]AOG03464.1 hypothetical protein BSY19_5030 [Bosea sp. RAC05]